MTFRTPNTLIQVVAAIRHVHRGRSSSVVVVAVAAIWMTLTKPGRGDGLFRLLPLEQRAPEPGLPLLVGDRVRRLIDDDDRHARSGRCLVGRIGRPAAGG